MKLDSKFFDGIRVAARRAASDRADCPRCQWKGCSGDGAHRAPKGRGHEGQYYLFCMDHVREYNSSYNYFDGMSAPEVEDYYKDALTGHRPTWKMGTGPMGPAAAHASWRHPGGADFGGRASDPHEFFARQAREQREAPLEQRRQLRPLEKKSFDALRLPPEGAPPGDVKARFKELVKRHHPDLNGGNTRSEDRLREVIQAYNFLKQAGLA